MENKKNLLEKLKTENAKGKEQMCVCECGCAMWKGS